MEKIFGSYHDGSDFDDSKLPDNTDFLRKNNIFSYDSQEAGQLRQRFVEKIEAGETLYLTGFNAGHNSGISLVAASKQDGINVLANYEEERFAAIKHFAGYPAQSIKEIKELLTRLGKTSQDIFAILYAWDSVQEEKYGQKMLLVNSKIIKNKYFSHISAAAAPNLEPGDDIGSKRTNLYTHSPGLVSMYERMLRELQLDTNVPCIYLPHHENHAYFSYGVSPFYDQNAEQTTMISCIDGAGDFSCASLYTAKASSIEVVKRIPRENSLGVFYMLCASFLGGWSALSSEGRYMGAAAWGNGNRLTNPYYKRLRQFFYFSGNGDVHVNNAMTENEYGALQDIVGPFLEIEDIWNPDAVINVDDIEHYKNTRDRVDKAAAVQMVFEDVLFHITAHLINVSGSDQLVLCGGTALNCVANMRLLEHFNRDYFRKYLDLDTRLHLWVPPVPSDQGVVVGAAYQFAMRNSVKPQGKLHSPFLCGLPPSQDSIDKTLKQTDFIHFEPLGNVRDEDIGQNIADWMAYIVSQNGVIGIYQGEAETGPRALGHRSILCNPCNPKSLELLNSRVKLRERIRPLAPMVTLEHAKKWFKLSDGASVGNYDAYNYMVLTVAATDAAKSVIPAVIHYDGTSRIQIVRKENNLLIYKYLQALGRYIGVEVSVNTSLNVASPMVQTPDQALQIFKRAQGLDGLVMINEDGDAFMVWAKEGVQKYSSNIPKIRKNYDKIKTGNIQNGEQIIQAYKEKRISLAEAKEGLENILSSKAVGLKKENMPGEETKAGHDSRVKKQNNSDKYESGTRQTEIKESNTGPRSTNYEELTTNIAIIGMSGRFPDAKNVHEFWLNLENGRDSVAKAPEDRGWHIDYYYNATPQTPGKTYTKYGAYLKDIDLFDPLFFGISPREAEFMDPSERLFLEESYRAIEDAGYAPENLAGKPWGVFACAKGDYSIAIHNQHPTYLATTDSASCSRLSYLLDLQGPAVSVDTACSSTLAAIAYACDSLMLGNCEAAIVGGGGIYSTPNMLVSSSQSLLYSPDGKCFTFDERANGTVLGEAVGAIVLKPLKKAIGDRDHIYGVIKGWGTNQDGKTNGMTAPSATSQIQLQTNIYNRFKINPENISLVETHGTGTKLGDPIEIRALNESFQKFTNKTGYCALGSLKTNVGHAFFGAGLSGVIKVLMALRHSTIPPIINYETLNPYISLENSPFYINTKAVPWTKESNKPRCAAVNAFGATGINVHLVIEEFEPKAYGVEPVQAFRYSISQLIVLSAKNNDRLLALARGLYDFMENAGSKGEEIGLADLAYTLQVGRDAMEERLAFVAISTNEVKEKLKDFINGSVSGVYQGQIKGNKETLALFEADEDMATTIKAWIDKGKYEKLLELWVKGFIFDWHNLYIDSKPCVTTHKGNSSRQTLQPCRISLPGYPFAGQSYWVAERKSQIGKAKLLHPLVHQNTSDLTQQRFTSSFSGDEFFLAGHVINGQRILPGVAYLEMARTAYCLAAGSLKDTEKIRIKNVVWTRPLVVNEELATIHVSLFPGGNGEVGYEVYSELLESNEPVVHCQGRVVRLDSQYVEPKRIKLSEIKASCNQNILDKSQCYERFNAMGIDYGPVHRGIEKLFTGSGQVLAQLCLDPDYRSTLNQFVLHPGLLDSVLQAAMGLTIQTESIKKENESVGPTLPFVLEEVDILGTCSARMWALIRYSAQQEASGKTARLDMDLCDEEGNLCVQMKGFSSRPIELKHHLGESNDTGLPDKAASDTLILHPVWKALETEKEKSTLVYSKRLVMLIDSCEIYKQSILDKVEDAQCLIVQTKEKKKNKHTIAQRYEILATQVFGEIKKILQTKPAGTVFIQIVIQEQDQLFAAVAAILKTAQLENSKVRGQLVQVGSEEDSTGIIDKLEISSTSYEFLIRFQENKAHFADWQDIKTLPQIPDMPWKDQGVYLITGGAGGLGLIFARLIAQNTQKSTLILAGRSKLSKNKKKAIEKCKSFGAEVVYRQVDVSQSSDVLAFIEDIHKDFGTFDGIIHSAGIVKDSLILNKSKKEFTEVLAAKVKGVVNLDQTCKDFKLDFFLIFSSMAGVMGNLGQADYAAANAFMDLYAGYRDDLVQLHKRSGQTLSINWPLWEEGGMTVDSQTEQWMHDTSGMRAMQTDAGIKAFYQAYASGGSQVMVMAGDTGKIKQKLLLKWPSGERLSEGHVVKSEEYAVDGHLRDKIENALQQKVSLILKVKPQDMDVNSDLSEYGFDSISFTELTNILNREYKLDLVPTIFFDYPSLREFASYLAETQQTLFVEKLNLQNRANNQSREIIEKQAAHAPRSRFVKRVSTEKSTAPNTQEPLAIVGMSGQFPKARDVNEFWDNLVEGRDCIEEIPAFRWDWRAYYGDPQHDASKTNIKWGGFIDGIDKFDPLFFGISPREAELTDPQQRLLLIHTWKAIEDAGYAASDISGTKTAIFVGTVSTGYSSLVARAQVGVHAYSSTSSAPSVGPNRMSYFLNLHGPSEPVETACSSSLVAIHRAMEAIQSGTCDMALVGGVNTIVVPESHMAFNQAGMLSQDGRCKTFSDKANGYVRAEGAGMIFIKKLIDAQQAGDHIYGVIKSSAENHGGRANSLTAPNPRAQAELLKTAYGRAGLDPASITYIEAHGTGTELGDPIEIEALKNAFDQLQHGVPTIKKPYCGLGSVKSNIGHTEMAAGIAGVIKVLLQLKHKTLVKSLHCDTVNPYIRLEDSPFFIVGENTKWQAIQDQQGNDLPRRAGVSSFGFGGANAHVVIEEWPKEAEEEIKIDPQLIVLSGKDEKRLEAQARQLLDRLRSGDIKESAFNSLAYTLQVGREPMVQRLAFMALDLSEIESKLDGFLGNKEVPDLFQGQVDQGKETLDEITSDTELKGAIAKWIEKDRSKLLKFWVRGLDVDWNQLYPDIKPKRIALPTYPFEERTCWVSNTPSNIRADQGKTKVNETQDIRTYIQSYIVRECKLEPSFVTQDKDFGFFGVDSILSLRLKRDLEEVLGKELTGRKFFEYRTIESLAAYLDQETVYHNMVEYVSEQANGYDPELEILEKFKQDELTLEEALKCV